jgi:MSHA pilin protein MshB
MNRRKLPRAFTLVELIMVIVIIGLLAAVVIPKYTDLRNEARAAAEQGTVSAVVSGIKLYHLSELAKGNNTYPAALDAASNGAGSDTNLLFANIIEGGSNDKNWSKAAADTYTYTPTGSNYKYTSASGTFVKQ